MTTIKYLASMLVTAATALALSGAASYPETLKPTTVNRVYQAQFAPNTNAGPVMQALGEFGIDKVKPLSILPKAIVMQGLNEDNTKAFIIFVEFVDTTQKSIARVIVTQTEFDPRLLRKNEVESPEEAEPTQSI